MIPSNILAATIKGHAVVAQLGEGSQFQSALFIALVVNLALTVAYVVFAILAIRLILKRGKGVEVPAWIALVIFVPVIGAVLAMIYFRASRHGAEGVVNR